MEECLVEILEKKEEILEQFPGGIDKEIVGSFSEEIVWRILAGEGV